jgi:hypothetical protein
MTRATIVDRRAMAPRPPARDHGAMTLADRATAARLVLVERRDTVAVRDPRAARVRRYRLARTELARRAGPRDVAARYRPSGA